MADIGITVERPVYSVAVTATPPPAVNVGVQLVRPQITVTVAPSTQPITLVNDTAPKLGGDLDLNNFQITGLLDAGLL